MIKQIEDKPGNVLFYSLNQYVDLMQEKFDSNKTRTTRIMALALPLFQLKSALSYTAATVLRIPILVVNTLAFTGLLFLEPKSLAVTMCAKIFISTPHVFSVIKLAIKASLYALGIILSPSIGVIKPDWFFKYNHLQNNGVEQRVKEIESSTPVVNPETLGFDAIVGMDSVKQNLQHVITVLTHSEEAKLYNIPGLSSGAIFHGKPGCGKSFFAKRFVEEIQKQTGKKVGTHEMKASEAKSKYVHGSVEKISNIFQKAAEEAKKNKSISVIIIDEIDAIIPSGMNVEGNSTVAQSYNEERGEFLVQLENAAKNNIFVIGTTNYLDKIDNAMKRPGRFNHIIEVAFPDEEARVNLLKKFLEGVPIDESFEYVKYSKQLKGYSVAEIKLLVEKVCIDAMEKTINSKKLNPNVMNQQVNHEIFDRVLEIFPSRIKQERLIVVDRPVVNNHPKQVKGFFSKFFKNEN